MSVHCTILPTFCVFETCHSKIVCVWGGELTNRNSCSLKVSYCFHDLAYSSSRVLVFTLYRLKHMWYIRFRKWDTLVVNCILCYSAEPPLILPNAFHLTLTTVLGFATFQQVENASWMGRGAGFLILKFRPFTFNDLTCS